MEVKQVPIDRLSYRLLYDTPGHATYGVWINGAKSGELTVRKEEQVAFEELMNRSGYVLKR